VLEYEESEEKEPKVFLLVDGVGDITSTLPGSILEIKVRLVVGTLLTVDNALIEFAMVDEVKTIEATLSLAFVAASVDGIVAAIVTFRFTGEPPRRLAGRTAGAFAILTV
jgi:hypothetical protein